MGEGKDKEKRERSKKIGKRKEKVIVDTGQGKG